MFRRYFLPLLAIVLVLSTSMLVSAQSGQVTGQINLKQADGTIVPASEAVIDIFRVDLPGDFSLKSNKRGVFVHAGLPIQGTYTVAVSMPGAQPTYVPDVRPGSGADLKIELVTGDGTRLKRDDIKKLMARTPGAPAGGGKETATEKAAREELIRKNKEIEESNKRAESSNAIIDRTFKAGNDALRAKNYELAITQYDEGLTADPDHPGAPALLTNKTMALNARAVEKFNAGVNAAAEAAKTADEGVKATKQKISAESIEAAKKDWQAASESGTRAVTLLKALPAGADAAAAGAQQKNLYFALLARAEAMRLFVVKVDQTKVDDGVAAYREYIAAEADPIKKTKAISDLAQMLFDANVFDRALAEYKKILEANPDDLNALLRSGQALFNIGAINNGDKLQYQEAANYLAQFVAKAPDTDPYKADAKAILETLKEQANVKPEKAPTPARRTRRP